MVLTRSTLANNLYLRRGRGRLQGHHARAGQKERQVLRQRYDLLHQIGKRRQGGVSGLRVQDGYDGFHAHADSEALKTERSGGGHVPLDGCDRIQKYAQPTGRQRSIAYAAINAGADLVLGAHTHRLNGVERYKGKYIVYDMGNFVTIAANPLNKFGPSNPRGKYDYDSMITSRSSTSGRMASSSQPPSPSSTARSPRRQALVNDAQPMPYTDSEDIDRVKSIVRATPPATFRSIPSRSRIDDLKRQSGERSLRTFLTLMLVLSLTLGMASVAQAKTATRITMSRRTMTMDWGTRFTLAVTVTPSGASDEFHSLDFQQ